MARTHTLLTSHRVHPVCRYTGLDTSSCPVVGDVTDRVVVLDLGTEVSGEFGSDPDRLGNQRGSSIGTAESEPVSVLTSLDATDYDVVTVAVV